MKKIYAVMLAVGFLAMSTLGMNGSAAVYYDYYEQPQFTSIVNDITVDEGQTVRMSFTVRGVPTPTVEVYRNGRKIHFENQVWYQLNYINGKVIFTIYDVVPEDSGEYTFKLTNAAGTASMYVKLRVREWIQ